MTFGADIKLRFGKYKGRQLQDVPLDYLRWCVVNDVLKGKAALYAKKKVNFPRDKFKVTVEDAVYGDGTYYVNAYTKDDAIYETKKRYKIQVTQSYCGTSFIVTKVEKHG